MKNNMGSLDKFIRLVIASVLVALYFTKIFSGTFAWIAIIFAAIFLLTSVISFCPLYTVLGLNTCKTK